MSPESFLIAAETVSSLKRKSRFPSITSNQAKKFHLDPTPTADDTTILKYYQRSSGELPGDRSKLHIAIPFEETWDGVLKELKDLRCDISILIKDKLELFAGNALIDLGRFILKLNPQESHSTHRLKQLASRITVQQLKDRNIPIKYHPLLKALPEMIEKRNLSAHDTKANFARLLLSDSIKDTNTFYLWKDIFPVLYGGEVQKIAQIETLSDMMLGSTLEA